MLPKTDERRRDHRALVVALVVAGDASSRDRWAWDHATLGAL